MTVSIHPISALKGESVLADNILRLASRTPRGPQSPRSSDGEPSSSSDADLVYRVELWNAENTAVERVLAVASSVSIGFAAYHAALQDYPERHITYRHRDRMIAQSRKAAN
jgi:hypothetical protein